jgi:phosphotriesterase-related protein
VDSHTVDEIAASFIREMTEGIDQTGVRAGVIGEIGCDAYLTAQEERVFRAAARAQKQTGRTITTHASRWPVGHAQLDVLEDEGVDPHRVIIGHCDSVTSSTWTSYDEIKDHHESLARRGAYVQFDHFGTFVSRYHDQVSVDYVVHLIQKGFTRQILLSHDVCFTSSLRAHGGNGYDFLMMDTLPRLRAAGVSEDTIHTLTVENPRRALTGETIL